MLSFPPLHHMLEENYLEQHKETGGGNLYYIDYKHNCFNICLLRRWRLSNTTNNN